MDPFSIAGTCMGLISIIAKASLSITKFKHDVCDAPREMDAVSCELLSLKAVLDTLARDITSPGRKPYPPSLAAHIPDILMNCNDVMIQLDQTLNKYSGRSVGAGAQWFWFGRQEVDQLRSSLETFKNILGLTIELSTLSITREVKADIQDVRLEATAMKMGISEILSFIRRLGVTKQQASASHDSYILQKYLDELTSYAETAYQESMVDIEESPQSPIFVKVGGDDPHNMASRPSVSGAAWEQSNTEAVPEVRLGQQATIKPSSVTQKLPDSELMPQQKESEKHQLRKRFSFEDYSSEEKMPMSDKGSTSFESIDLRWSYDSYAAEKAIYHTERPDKSQFGQDTKAPHGFKERKTDGPQINHYSPDNHIAFSTSSVNRMARRQYRGVSLTDLTPARLFSQSSIAKAGESKPSVLAASNHPPTLSKTTMTSSKEIARPVNPRIVSSSGGERANSLINHGKISAAGSQRGKLSENDCIYWDEELCKISENTTARQFEKVLQKGADPNSDTSSLYPIHYAIQSENIDCLRLLLEYGADPEAISEIETPLIQALRVDNELFSLQAMNLLHKAGANPNVIVPTGGSPLHIAVNRYRPNFEIISLLVTNGANPHLPADCIYLGQRTRSHWFRGRRSNITPVQLVDRRLFRGGVDRKRLKAILLSIEPYARVPPVPHHRHST